MSDPSSPRLRYRRAAAGDADALHRHWNLHDVRRHLWDDQPVAPDTVAAVLAASAADFASGQYGLWILEDDEPGIVGTCGLRLVDAGDASAADLEVLYSIDPARWGRGLATEAAAAVLAYAFSRLGRTRVLGGVDAANVASRRVLEKLGMTGPLTVAGAPDGVAYLAVERARFRSTLP